MKERVCPSCGGTVESEEAKFCPLCGAALTEAPPCEDAADLEGKIRTRYHAYADWVEQFRGKESGARRLLDLVTSSSPFKNSEEHAKFFDEVKDMTEALEAAYRAAPGTGDISALLHFTLIECHGFAKTDADWMFLAAEQLYLPFLPLLSREDAAALLPGYQALRKKQKGFAFQKEILKKLKSLGK